MLAAAAGSVSAGYVADLLGRRDVRRRLVVPAVAAIATAATLGLAFAATPPGAAQLALIFLGAATATAAVGPAATVVIDVVEPGLRATATSLYVLVQNLFGLAVGPVLTGVLADRWGLSVAIAVVPGLGVAAAVALWWASGSYAGERNALHGTSPG
jgi:MFS family permease